MSHHELRNGDQARRFLLEGLWLQRVSPPTATTVMTGLRWALEIASAGQPLPPIGFAVDLGLVALAQDHGARAQRAGTAAVGLAPGQARAYEDYVLGKLYADWTFERAGDALRRYQGRDRGRGLAFLVNQVEPNRNYQKSDLLQLIRILKNYEFFKEPQLDLFRPKRKRKA